MAIKIIKQGTKEFHITCPHCGCEFTYENEDVYNSEVICPCCSKALPHKGVRGKVDESPLPINGWYGTITNLHGTYPYNDLVYRPFTLPDWATKSDNLSGCEGCPNNPPAAVVAICGGKEMSAIERRTIEEFVEKLKKKVHNYYPSIDCYCTSKHVILVKDIDELLKEYKNEQES